MPTKDELLDEAARLGLDDVKYTMKKADIEAAIEAATSSGSSDEGASDDASFEVGESATTTVIVVEPTSVPEPPSEEERAASESFARTGAYCDNCGEPAVYVSDGDLASIISLCAKHHKG